MQRVSDIIAFVEESTGHPIHTDEGVWHGSADDEVEDVLLCWQATRDVLERAGQEGTDLVIGHESLYYPYDVLGGREGPEGWEEWP
ncbi:MAG: Nif3-like dinuclear metal center hexameric protein, partial [Candidatus Brocadiaceae bacterium]